MLFDDHLHGMWEYVSNINSVYCVLISVRRTIARKQAVIFLNEAAEWPNAYSVSVLVDSSGGRRWHGMDVSHHFYRSLPSAHT